MKFFLTHIARKVTRTWVTKRHGCMGAPPRDSRKNARVRHKPPRNVGEASPLVEPPLPPQSPTPWQQGARAAHAPLSVPQALYPHDTERERTEPWLRPVRAAASHLSHRSREQRAPGSVSTHWIKRGNRQPSRRGPPDRPRRFTASPSLSSFGPRIHGEKSFRHMVPCSSEGTEHEHVLRVAQQSASRVLPPTPSRHKLSSHAKDVIPVPPASTGCTTRHFPPTLPVMFHRPSSDRRADRATRESHTLAIGRRETMPRTTRPSDATDQSLLLFRGPTLPHLAVFQRSIGLSPSRFNTKKLATQPNMPKP